MPSTPFFPKIFTMCQPTKKIRIDLEKNELALPLEAFAPAQDTPTLSFFSGSFPSFFPRPACNIPLGWCKTCLLKLAARPWLRMVQQAGLEGRPAKIGQGPRELFSKKEGGKWPLRRRRRPVVQPTLASGLLFSQPVEHLQQRALRIIVSVY